MSSAPAPAPEEIASDARWLAQALDPAQGIVRLVAMDRDGYRAASFLDDRMLQRPVDARLVPWLQVEAALTPALRTDARWIFHIGRVGSTLISRLLGELDNVLAIREPRLLRDVALSPPEVRQRYIASLPKLMSRSFAPEEMACVKATSFVSEMAPELVPAGERALFLYAKPLNYIANTLTSADSVEELHFLAPGRAQRLARRVPALGPAHSDADLAAIAWACEMTALEEAADAMGDRKVDWADFDVMLRDMEAALGRTAAFFGMSADPAEVRAIANGPLMKLYSKDAAYDFSGALRSEMIAEATNLNREIIERALAMLDRAAEKSPLLERALARAREG